MKFQLDANKPLDAICLGRAGVDLYANEHNVDFVDVTGFKKYVGGSSANIAVAMSTLDCKVGLITALSDDMLGDYVKQYISSKGINTDGVQTSPEGSRTSLAVTEMKADDCGVVIYRNNAADLLLDAQQISEDYVASAKMLVLTGTAFAQEPSQSAAFKAIEYARDNNTLVVLDLDYRAYSWESPEVAAECMRKAASLSEVVIGNREEFDVLEHGMSISDPSDDNTAKRFLVENTQLIILKAGHLGSKTYTVEGDYIEQGIYPVDVVKPFGAGDSFAGSVLYSMINGLPIEQGLKLGAAAASINVSSDNCSEAMPNVAQIESFLETQIS